MHASQSYSNPEWLLRPASRLRGSRSSPARLTHPPSLSCVGRTRREDCGMDFPALGQCLLKAGMCARVWL